MLTKRETIDWLSIICGVFWVTLWTVAMLSGSNPIGFVVICLLALVWPGLIMIAAGFYGFNPSVLILTMINKKHELEAKRGIRS